MHSVEAAGVIPYRHKDRRLEFLLVQHRHDHWEFPKGKIDHGETEQQTALRELAEEAGVTAHVHDNFHEIIEYTFFDIYTNQVVQKRVHFFIGEVIGDNVQISDEHTAFIWLPFEQAYALLTHTESKSLLTKAAAFLVK